MSINPRIIADMRAQPLKLTTPDDQGRQSAPVHVAVSLIRAEDYFEQFFFALVQAIEPACTFG